MTSSKLTISIPLLAYDTPQGSRLLQGPLDSGTLWPESAKADLLASVEDECQQLLLQGVSELNFLLSLSGLHVDKVRVDYEARHHNAPLSIDYDWLHLRAPKGFWGFLPASGLSMWASSLEDLRHRLGAQMRERYKHLPEPQSLEVLLADLWYEQLSLIPAEVTIALDAEVESADDEGADLLHSVAAPLQLEEVMAYGLDGAVETLLMRMRGEHMQNLLIVGDPGSGKSSLIYELVRALAKNPQQGYTFWETDAARMLKGLMSYGKAWQHQLPQLLDALESRRAVLVVHRLKELYELGQYEGSDQSIGQALHNQLKDKKVIIFAEATEEDLSWMELSRPGFSHSFYLHRLSRHKLDIMQIAAQVSSAMAAQYPVDMEPAALEEAVSLMKRFFPYSGMPGKALRFIENLFQEHSERSVSATISIEDVRKSFAREARFPIELLHPASGLSTEGIAHFFRQRVIGQERAIRLVASMLLRFKSGVSQMGKPIASMLFVGPTGVGKTEMARILATYMFGSPDALTRFDMSEYSSPHAVFRLIGGHEGGTLTRAVRQRPLSVLLFDEIEKADATFFDLLLQVLDDGRLTGEDGLLTDFGATVIVMTSNIGAEKLGQRPIGWKEPDQEIDLVAAYTREVRRALRPELYNRIDDVVPFSPLNKQDVALLVKMELDKFKQRVGFEERDIDLELTQAALEWLLKKGYDPMYGARKLQRQLRQYLFIPVAQAVHVADLDEAISIIVDVESPDAEQLQLTTQYTPEPFEDLIGQLEVTSSADLATQLRLQLHRFSVSHRWRKLQQKLDELEGQMSDREKASWSGEQAAHFHLLHLLRTEWESLNNRIVELEGQLLENALTSGDRDDIDERLIQQWSTDFTDLLLQLLEVMEPQACRAHLTIGGKNLEPVLNMYRSLAKEKGWKTQFAIWKMARHGDASKKSRKQKKVNYERTELNHATMLEASLAKQDVIAVELILKGAGVLPYLQPEAGLQEWILPGGPPSSYMVWVSDKAQLPQGVHRKEFFRKEPVKRRLTGDNLHDLAWKYRINASPEQWPAHIAERLDQIFQQSLHEWSAT